MAFSLWLLVFFFSYMLRATGYQLDRVDEGFFDPVEDHHAVEEDHEHEDAAVAQAPPGGGASAEEASPEGLDDGGVRIEHSFDLLNREESEER